jgi:hypothetical protein
MKGIRLYAHERRLATAFGKRGLRVGARRLAAMRAALEADLDFLAGRNLVDFSYARRELLMRTEPL